MAWRYGGLVSAFCGPRSTPLQVKAHSQPAPGGIRSHSDDQRFMDVAKILMDRSLIGTGGSTKVQDDGDSSPLHEEKALLELDGAGTVSG